MPTTNLSRAALTVLIALTTAGCFEPGPDTEPTDATLPTQAGPGPEGPGVLPNGTRAPAALLLDSCVEAVGRVPVAAGDAAALLPEGFQVSGDPVLVIEARRCTVQGITYSTMVAGIPVDPPADLALSAAAEHRVLLAGILPSAEVRALFAAWGLDAIAQPGDATVLTPPPRPVPGVTHSIAENDNLTLDLYVSHDSSSENAPETTVRNFVVRDQEITGAFDATTEARSAMVGTSIVQVQGPGAPAQPAQANGEGVEYSNADITYTYVAAVHGNATA